MSLEWGIPNGDFNNKEDYINAYHKSIMPPKQLYHLIDWELYKYFKTLDKENG